ncbi:ABC transporter substrate-binding protein [Vibrio agarivorans]|uniref:ABC transporter substrate-binding protein n=1 Tax=Vibrio agarivorans TaxID=153622 RepID=UPI00222FBCB0|nr:spermidine/putrescine ABC transporter substrate-binding protein [Vibrio agarivorans]MDN3659870.1 spermidine/putrescine ABC transporter substrate-binding protein [Vibrio agarivorans]
MTRPIKLSYLLMIAAAASVHADDKGLHLYNWEEFMSEKVLADFQSQTGIKVFQQYFSDESIRDEVILSERGRSFDVVVVESVRLSILAEQGLFTNMREFQQSLAARFDDRWLKACGDYGIPYAWGTTGILYRTDRVETPTSWAALYAPQERLKGRIAMYYEPTDLVGGAMLLAEQDPFSDDIDALKKVYPILEKQAGYLYSSNYVLEYLSMPNKLDVIDVAFGYGGDSYVLNEHTEGEPWGYVVPEEGTTLWLECLAVVQKKNINPDTFTFIDFITQPDNAAVNAEDAWFSTPVSKARELTSLEYSQDRELFPPQSVIDRSYIYRRMSEDALRIRNRITESLRK